MSDYDELMDEAGGEAGDPRRCGRHPEVVTGSPDGMFDAPCGKCESEMDDPSETCGACGFTAEPCLGWDRREDGTWRCPACQG